MMQRPIASTHNHSMSNSGEHWLTKVALSYSCVKVAKLCFQLWTDPASERPVIIGFSVKL